MSISGPFIRRPVATTLVMSAILLFGTVAYRSLPVSDLPNVDLPTLLVNASLPGADPETMASAVATPLERQFSTIAGLTSMNSTSTLGQTQVTLQFDLSRDIDAAAQDVQSAITQASALLPRDMPTPPTYVKVNPADQPILYIGLTSPTLPLWQVDEYGETLMAQRISMVTGVAQVQVFGSQKYAVRVQLDPHALANRGIGIDEVANAVRQANVNLPTGTLFGAHQAVTVQATGQLTSAAQYRPIIVAYRDGAPVRLGELGRVIDSVENDKTASWYVDADTMQRSVVLAVQRQPGTNTVAVAEAVKALLPRFEQELPPSVQLRLLFDRSESIERSVRDVKRTLLIALVLVVLVIFLFLRNLSATIIPSLALPLSVIGAFAVMEPLGYSLDNLSLMALTLAVGFVVDDAIVVLENIVRHMEAGVGPFEAALKGAGEIGFTIVSMTISLAAVFIPVLFMPGVLGRLFHEFAVTICVAILISGFVSLTLTPMLCSRLLRPVQRAQRGRLDLRMERVLDASLAGYERSLRWVLRHRAATLGASVVVLALTAWLFVIVPKGFIPDEDQGAIFGVTEAQQGISFEAMVKHQLAVADIARHDPAVEKLFTSVASTGTTTTTNQGRMFLHLKPRDERDSIPVIIARLRKKLAPVPGMQVYLQALPTIRIGGQLTKSLYQFTLQGTDTDALYDAAPKLEARLRKLPALTDVTTDLQIRNPQVEVQIDRDQAAALGVSAQQIEDALYDAYGSRWISTIYAPNNAYRVIVELENQYQRDANALSMLYVRAAGGRLVPLGAVAHFHENVGPLAVNHAGQLPAVTISFNLAPGVALGDAVKQVRQEAAQVLPSSITTSFEGTAEAFASSLSGLAALLVFTVLVIYLVLGILYESFVHPLTILSGLPSAGVGALLTLLVFRTDLNIYAFVGLVMLIGIVKKNAIMQIDFALAAQRQEGKPPLDAIYEGCVIRFRPIMMTTMAALLGTLPIAIGLGAGGEARRPLGLAVVGGLLLSQLVTLYLTPVYYVYLDALATRLRLRPAAAPELATLADTAEAPADDQLSARRRAHP
jgi:HAE1 family hydrophobic/amphiphilic exporter-1